MRPTLTCVEGVGMFRHSARLVRFAGGALVATAIAPWLGGAVAHADDLVSGDPRATAVAGNIHDDPEHAGTICQQLGFANDTEVGADNADGYNADGTEFDSDGTYLDAISVPAGKQIDVVVVKAGDFYNRYDAAVFTTLPVNDMHGPLVGQAKNVPTISHWAACIGDVPPTPPSGTVTGDCNNATVHMDGGTEGGSFSIDPAGTGSAISEQLGAGDTKTDIVPVDADHPTVTLTIDGEVPGGSFTRSSDCDQVESTTDPAVSFGNNCTAGITVTLTNMQVDDTTTAPVTFTVVSPSGHSKQVTVRADQIVKLTFKVKEDTTATVTVTAPGLSKTTHSYAKNCTQVLGEKVVKTPKAPKPTVQGEQAQLPFTGMPTAVVAALGALMLAVGGGLSVLGRRREAEVSAS